MKKALSLILALTMILSMGAFACASEGTDWPAGGTLNILVPAKAGGINDTIARFMQEYLQNECGATVVVTNYDTKAVAYDALKNADPDGYTIMIQHTTIFPEAAAGSAGVDPMTDYTVLGKINDCGPCAYVAPSDAPYDDFEGLIEYAKENPGKVSAGYAAGGLSHFQWGAIEQAAGIELKMLDAANETEKLTNVAGGFLDLASTTYNAAKEFADAGKLKILSVAGHPADVEETGYQEMEDLGYDTLAVLFMYVFGPAGMDEETAQAINDVLVAMSNDETFQESMNKAGFPPVATTLEDAAADAQAEMDAAVQLAEDLGLAS